MVKLQRVSGIDLTTIELGWIKTLGELSVFGYDHNNIIDQDYAGTLQFWRVYTDPSLFDEADKQSTQGQGLIVSDIRVHPLGKEFIGYGLIGRGVVSTETWDEVRKLAKALDCRWITLNTPKPGIVRLYKRILNLHPRVWTFIEEL